MAPTGPPSDPRDPDDRRDERPERDVADWDWGSDWDAEGDDHRPAADPAAREDRSSEDAGDRDDAEADAPDPADDPAPSPDPPVAPPARPRPAGRRRLVGAAAVLLAVAIVAAVALGGGDATDDGATTTAGSTDGGELRSLTGVAARATADRVERAAAVERYAKLGLPVYCGAGRKPWVALTFDDGPGPLSGRWIAAMAKADAPMTLFRIGRNVPGNEEYVRVQRNLGWDSGTHTQNHPALATLSAKDQREEIVAGDDASTRVLGRPPRLFRPPYESHDRDTDRIVEREGMVEVLWNVDTQDSLGRTSVREIVSAATKGMQPGSIILMHEVKPTTLEAMPRILAALRAKGLKPVTVSRMLASDGPTEAQLRKGYDGCRVDVTPGRASS